jgi:peptide/nickel transport system ATP-binding protein
MVLEIRNVTKKFGKVVAVDHVSFNVMEGESLAIIGESGCGKTTLAKMMIGLMRPDEGEIVVQRKDVQMVFQDPYTSLDPLYDVRGILREAFWMQKTSRDTQEANMQAMLKAVGLPSDALERFPHEFSGGERQRIAIARALLAKGRILILDEAVSSLDVLVQKQILELLTKLKHEFNLTYIFISHNLRVVRNFSDKIIIMKSGGIIEAASKNDVFNNPTHPYTRQMLEAAFNYKTYVL